MSNIVLDAFYSLSRRLNKVGGDDISAETETGAVSEKFPELKLDMENADLLKLTEKWEDTWKTSGVKTEWDKHGTDNEDYWLGKHFQRPQASKVRDPIDNAIFESVETYLPQMTRRNPEAMVELAKGIKESPETTAFAEGLKDKLAELADELKLRLKLKKAGRHWAIYLLGAAKMGWDMNKDMPTVKIIRPKKLILDPEATVDEDGYTGTFIGEYRKMEAGTLIKLLEKIGPEAGAIEKVKKDVKEALGTSYQFIEWWTDEYLCWTVEKQVLMKKKNPHWNYDSEQEAPYGDDGQPQLNAEGKPRMEPVPGINHFAVPGKPFILLSVFNLGKQPVDETSLIGQNLSNQDRINKRVRQIDKNADSMNGGMIVSLARSGLTQPQAKQVTEALRKGGTVSIPDGAPDEAIKRDSAPPLPPDIYNDLNDTRIRLKDLFGTRGSMPSGLEKEKTIGGKLITKGTDTDRIGGGVSEYLEQFADDIYNWFIQLLYVYDEQYIGKPKPKVKVSVKEGSLLPKDSVTLANQAIELANAGKMALIDLYKQLDYPNPEELAANVWLESNAPEILFPNDQRIQQVIQAKQEAAANAAGKPPSESINFKDLPPEGKAQMAKQAGIELHPEAIAAHDAEIKLKDSEREVTTEAGKRSIPVPKPEKAK